MKVSRFFRQDVLYVERGDTLRTVANLMRRGGLSCLPVLAGDSVEGIIMERDLVEAVAHGDRPSEAHVAEYMHGDPVTVSLDDESTAAATKMLAIGCRHLPVIDAGKLVGMVSMHDLYLATARVEAEGVLV